MTFTQHVLPILSQVGLDCLRLAKQTDDRGLNFTRVHLPSPADVRKGAFSISIAVKSFAPFATIATATVRDQPDIESTVDLKVSSEHGTCLRGLHYSMGL